MNTGLRRGAPASREPRWAGLLPGFGLGSFLEIATEPETASRRQDAQDREGGTDRTTGAEPASAAPAARTRCVGGVRQMGKTLRKSGLFALAIAPLFGLAASQTGAAPAAADIRAGERLVAAAPAGGVACAGCHGPRGEGMANFPRLAGSGAVYLEAQLEAFATGARKNQIMQPIAQALSTQQRGQVAAYFSSLPGPASSADRAARSASDTGAWLATRGRWEDEVPACAQCHGPGGMGVGDAFPPLAGQSATYLADQLRAWQSGARPPGPLGLMRKIARHLSAADIQAVSEYYAGLAGTAAAPATAASSAPTRRAAP